MTTPAAPRDVPAEGPATPQTTPALAAKVDLRRAWFESHPNQPLPEGRAQVDALFDAIEQQARQAALDDVRRAFRDHAYPGALGHPTLVQRWLDEADAILDAALADTGSAGDD